MNAIRSVDETDSFEDPDQRGADGVQRILAVDDDRTALLFLTEELRALGYETTGASDGNQCIETLKENPNLFDVIVLDKVMPGMDGLSVVRYLKNDERLRHIPIVMLTGDNSPEEIREGVDAGVFYYLTKPVENALLKSVINSALKDAAQKNVLLSNLKDQKRALGLIETCRMKCRTIEEAWDMAGFVSSLFPDPERALPGVTELLVNAIEHGNLGIGYELKSELLKSGSLFDEINSRLNLPKYRDRAVDVVFTHRGHGVCVVITDQGNGFDWKDYMEIDPSRASDSHGRGVARANSLSFDKLVFNETGNQVVGYMSLEKPLDW